MRYINTTLAILTCILVISLEPSHAGVSISIGEPGFFGRLEIGGYPAPRLIYPEPIVVHRVKTWYPPVYLRVPPAHSRHWYKYCGRYNACGRPVYFIDDVWYQDVYVPRYRERHHSHRPPHVVPSPHYYEYKKYEHRPPKRVYPRERYPDEYRGHHGNKHRN